MMKQGALTPEVFIQNPYKIFSLIGENKPVAWVEFFQTKAWLVTGFEEAEAALKDSRFIKEVRNIIPPEQLTSFPESVMPVIQMNRNMMLFRDAPNHTRLRGLVNKAFTPRMIERLRPTIEELATYLLQERNGEQNHELIRDFSYLLPMFVITDLLGVPKEDRDLFRKWSDAFVKFIDFNTTMEDLVMVSGDIKDAQNYFKVLISKRRLSPKEDLISNLIKVEEQAENLTEEELIATCILLLIAGHETTVNLITNGFYLLIKNPDQYDKLKNDLSLIQNAVEEILHYEPPVILTSRWVSEDMEFYGQSLKKAQFLLIALAAANRDERVVNNPNQFEVSRKYIKHLSFASGPHFCLGAPLARLEGQIALELLMKHVHQPSLTAEPKWRTTIGFRGLESLHFKAEIR